MSTSIARPFEVVEGADRVLWTSTFAFTASFAVWTIFAIIGLGIKSELGLSETEFGLLAGIPILSGSVSRIVLGVWTDKYGGRKIFAALMFISAAATYALNWADTYPKMLLAGLLVGLSGGTFSVGVPYVSRFFPPERQGLALGIFGAGNVGAAVTKFLAPMVMVAMGWRGVADVWALGLAISAVIFLLLTKDEPRDEARAQIAREPFLSQFKVLAHAQVWRFSLYYFFVFGAFVAISLWLPHYLIEVYGLSVKTAGMLAAFYSIPASLFRIYGGSLSDRYGARAVLYWTFGVGVVCTFMLSYPPTTYIIQGINGPITFSTSMDLVPFLVIMFVLGFFMSLGKAAVFKHVPVYYPEQVGAVSGLVGMIGGLGGFLLPLSFGVLEDLIGIRTGCFALLFLVVTASLIWMHVAIQGLERSAATGAATFAPSGLAAAQRGAGAIPAAAPARVAGELQAPERPARDDYVLTDWRPEDPVFWEQTGRRIARRNLWISTYCLALAFAVWQVWSIVVARLPAVGFNFTPNQLFWLAAIPGISGATLRIFYSFLVPIFGGRLWTAVSTASLLIPAFGIGYAVQNPQTPYLVFLALALLCGFGGGNFASSVANISFFFPRKEKGRALAINSGIGNLGVSVMQLVVPIVISMGLFGYLAGGPQTTAQGTSIWLQNAGFFWVPLVSLGVILAWFGMNDIGSAKASFTEQAVIFRRLHTWVMCWLYTGTFGTFIGVSAAFPLLTRLVFPDVDVLRYAFIGPLVGALSRAFSGGLSDRLGGERVSFWVFIVMTVATILMVVALGMQSFPFFFAMTLLLFFASGVGNASTFQMVPGIMSRVVDAEPGMGAEERRHEAERESAAITGFISAIAAYGAFFIPKALGSSIEASGTADAALYGFAFFFITCAVATWYFYTGPRGLFRTAEQRA